MRLYLGKIKTKIISNFYLQYSLTLFDYWNRIKTKSLKADVWVIKLDEWFLYVFILILTKKIKHVIQKNTRAIAVPGADLP